MPRWPVLVAMLVAWSGPAAAVPPPSFDLPALLECRAGIPAYVAFRRWLGDGGPDVAKAGFAWRRSTTFQGEYALTRPVTVFGLPARTIGLSNAGVLAVVAGVTPRQLATRLGLDPALDTPATFVANRLVFANDAAKAGAGRAQAAPDLDALFGDKPVRPAPVVEEIVQVVTNQGTPGLAAVGCNYVSTAQTSGLAFPKR